MRFLTYGMVTYVKRLYMIKRQTLTLQISRICICSTTMTILEPNSLIAIFSGDKSTSAGFSIRFVGVYVRTLTPIDTTVRQICPAGQLRGSPFASTGDCSYCRQHHDPIIDLQLFDGSIQHSSRNTLRQCQHKRRSMFVSRRTYSRAATTSTVIAYHTHNSASSADMATQLRQVHSDISTTKKHKDSKNKAQNAPWGMGQVKQT